MSNKSQSFQRTRKPPHIRGKVLLLKSQASPIFDHALLICILAPYVEVQLLTEGNEYNPTPASFDEQNSTSRLLQSNLKMKCMAAFRLEKSKHQSRLCLTL